jgi:hypothetical protein
MIRIFERGLRAHGQRLVNPLPHAFASDLHGVRDAGDGFASVIAAQDPSALNLSHRRCSGLAQLL